MGKKEARCDRSGSGIKERGSSTESDQRIASSLIEYIHGNAWRKAGSSTRMDQLINGSFIRSMPPTLVILINGMDRIIATVPVTRLTPAFVRSC